MDREFEKVRMQLWIDMCVNVSAASNCTNSDSGPNWADYALERFDEKFNEKQEDS